MDTKRLKQFCAIAETGSMTKASELLHITHSALSKSMKILQQEIMCQLFRPAGRGLMLTEAGLEIYRRTKEFLQYEKDLFKLEKKQDQSRLAIGAPEIFLFLLGEKLKYYRFENNIITLLDLDPGQMEQMVANRQLDFAISYAPFPMENIEITEIGKYHLGCFHLKDTFKGKNITEIPFVVPARNLLSNPLDIKERDGWVDNTYPRNKKFSVNLLSIAIELCLQGLCAIYIPTFVAKKINRVRKTTKPLIEYPLPKKEKNFHRAFIIKHKDRPEDAACKQLINMVKEIIL